MCSGAWVVVVVVVVVVVLGVVVGVEVQVYLRSSFVLQPKLCVLSNPLRSHILASGPNEEADPLPGIVPLVEPGRKLLLLVLLRPVIDDDGKERQRLSQEALQLTL